MVMSPRFCALAGGQRHGAVADHSGRSTVKTALAGAGYYEEVAEPVQERLSPHAGQDPAATAAKRARAAAGWLRKCIRAPTGCVPPAQGGKGRRGATDWLSPSSLSSLHSPRNAVSLPAPRSEPGSRSNIRRRLLLRTQQPPRASRPGRIENACKKTAVPFCQLIQMFESDTANRAYNPRLACYNILNLT